jgi:hypothetical protein
MQRPVRRAAKRKTLYVMEATATIGGYIDSVPQPPRHHSELAFGSSIQYEMMTLAVAQVF